MLKDIGETLWVILCALGLTVVMGGIEIGLMLCGVPLWVQGPLFIAGVLWYVALKEGWR